MGSETPIIPVKTGTVENTLRIAKHLTDNSIFAPIGSSNLVFLGDVQSGFRLYRRKLIDLAGFPGLEDAAQDVFAEQAVGR